MDELINSFSLPSGLAVEEEPEISFGSLNHCKNNIRNAE